MRRIVLVIALALLLLILAGWVSTRPAWLIDRRKVLPTGAGRQYARRSLSDIDQIVIHHSATPADTSIESIARYHIGPNHICADGCPGIAYHFMIGPDGKTYQVNDLEAVSYHVSGANTRSVGICLLGNYEEYPPTDLQYRRVIGLIRYLEAKTGRLLDVIGHKEASGANTQCPGANVDLELIRSEIYQNEA